MILVIHAFSRKNAGDALLVDLTLERLARLGFSDGSVVIAALDPESFANHHPAVVRVPGEPRSIVSVDALRAAMYRSNLIGNPGLDPLFGKAEAVIAVGGGYLHTSGLVESFGCWLNHLGQLKAAVKSASPSVYLPQSIGPLDGPIGASVRKLLHRVEFVAVRDDESLTDLLPGPNVHRMPDLAILELPRHVTSRRVAHTGDHSIVIGRSLTSGTRYERLFTRLVHDLSAPHFALQADVSGRKSDALFYERLGFKAQGTLRDLTDRLSGGVVISVRLHGALQALMFGWPAIHLSYDRKGRGAYADLGLNDYVHDAYQFDPEMVSEQAASIRSDPSPFWDKLDSSLQSIAQQDEELDHQLRRILR